MSDQLDLFSVPSPKPSFADVSMEGAPEKGTAIMLVFPLDRRVGKIRRVAELLNRKSNNEAEGYWSQTVKGLVRQMAKAGIPDHRIDAELHRFSAQVSAELARIDAQAEA